jgi:hypothetical protein
MATPETRYEFLVKEHKRLHDMVSYLESDSTSAKIRADIKKKKLAVKDELTKLKAELGIPDET